MVPSKRDEVRGASKRDEVRGASKRDEVRGPSKRDEVRGGVQEGRGARGTSSCHDVTEKERGCELPRWWCASEKR